MSHGSAPRFFSSLAIAFTLAFASGCASGASHTDKASREPSSANDLISDEALNRLLMDAESDVKLRTNYLDRLLRFSYCIEGGLIKFDKELDVILAAKKKNPALDPEPLKSETYRKIVNCRIMRDHVNGEFGQVYESLLKIALDKTVQESDNGGQANYFRNSDEEKSYRKGRAIRLVSGIHAALENLSEADKLQVMTLIEMLDEIYDEVSRTASTATPNGDRMPASVFIPYQEYKKAFKQYEPNDLSKLYKKHAKEFAKKGDAAIAASQSELDAMPAWDFAGDREPSEAKLFPSTGDSGNVVGRIFPRGTFVLTFDDGPKEASTNRLLGVLTSHKDSVNTNGAPASFFWLAKEAIKNKPTVAKTISLGFGTNSHSWSHANLAKAGPAGLDKEITQANATLKETYGRDFKFFRCPYGSCYLPKVPKVRQMIADAGMLHAYWAVDSADWQNLKNPARTVELTKKQILAVGRGVILFHDIHESSVDAVKLLLDWIKAQNAKAKTYRLMSIEAATNEMNGVRQ